MSLLTRRSGAATVLLVAACVLIAGPLSALAQEPPLVEVTGNGTTYYRSAFRYIRPPPKRPPPFRRPSPGVTGFVHAPELSELQILCRKVEDPITKYMIDDPDCNVPRATIATGAEASEIRNKEELLNGDEVTITLEEVDGPANRRRQLLALKEEIRTGRSLLQTAAKPTLPEAAFKFKGLRSIKKGSQKEIYAGKPIDLRTLVFIMDFSACKVPGAWGPASGVTVEKITRDMLRSPASPPNNLGNYYGVCSYEKTLFSPNNVMVIGPVPVNCSGGVTPPPRPPRPPRPPPRISSLLPLSRKNDTYDDWWDLSKFCTASEQQAWERTAELFAQKMVAAKPDDPEMKKLDAILKWRERRRNVYILPSSVKCSWAGYADVTCTSATCSSYVKGYTSNSIQVIMHEVMHNYGLEHAGRGSLEYGDATDVMGDFNKAGSGLLCPNAPNMFRIGWSRPINPPGTPAWTNSSDMPGLYGNLTAANFTGSNVLTGLTIPAQGTRDDNMVVINIGASMTGNNVPKIPFTTYYISYRIKNTTANGYDSGLQDGFSRKVLIHGYNGTQTERSFGFKPNLLDFGPNFASSKSGVWTSPWKPVSKSNGVDVGGSIRITVKSTSDREAVVDLCRMSQQKEDTTSCTDGLDNDCDGQQDGEDPDCQ